MLEYLDPADGWLTVGAASALRERRSQPALQASASAVPSRSANSIGMPLNSPTQAVFPAPQLPRCGASRA